jgi:hypothetical protein
MQEGNGEIQFSVPLFPGKSLLVCLYSRKELTTILHAKGFKAIAYKRRRPASEIEYPYNKLSSVAETTAGPFP